MPHERPTAPRLVLPILFVLLMLLSGCGEREAANINTVDDLERARIGVMTGSTSEPFVRQRFPAAEVQCFDDSMDAVTALLAGQLDSVVCGYPTGFLMTKNNPALHLLPEMLTKENASIVVRKGNRQLLAAADAFVADLQADGTLADMRRRWFHEGHGPYEEKAIAVPAQGVPLRVGVAATREPISFVDGRGEVSGHDGELARRLAVRLGRPLEFVNMKFMALIPALQAGKIDLIITGMACTPERSKLVDFSRLYFESGQVALVRRAPAAATVAGGWRSLADLSRGRIGTVHGTVHAVYAQGAYPDAQVVTYNNTADLIAAVKGDKVDTALLDQISAREVIKAHGELGRLDEGFLRYPLGMGFGRRHAELRARYDRFLEKIRADGRYDEIRRRWFVDDPTRVEMPDHRAAAPTSRYTLGVSVGDLPFVEVVKGRYTGFDIELLELFAAGEGIAFDILSLDFGALIPALAAGKVDVITDGMSITEERKKAVDFSAPYAESQAVAVALKSNLAAFSGAAANRAEGGFLAGLSDSLHANFVVEERWRLIANGLGVTAVLAVLSTLFGTLLGAAVCALRMSRRLLPQLCGRGYIFLLRGLPVVVLLMLIFYVVFASINISPLLVAVIAFGMNFAAYVAEMFRSGIEGIDRGQREAGIAMGFTRLQTFRRIILPQAVRRILPVYRGEFISLVKMTSIVGYIGVQDLTKASDIIRSRTFEAFFPLIMVAVFYFLIIWLLGQGLDYLDRRTDPLAQRRTGRNS